MRLKKKKMLQIFFISKNSNPIFFELFIDTVKYLNRNLAAKNKRIIKLRQSDKTITLFPIYLNIFATKKINTQKNEKGIYVSIDRGDLIEEKQRFFSKFLNKGLKPQNKVFFVHLYLNRYNQINTPQIKKSTQILQNLKMI